VANFGFKNFILIVQDFSISPAFMEEALILTKGKTSYKKCLFFKTQ